MINIDKSNLPAVTKLAKDMSPEQVYDLCAAMSVFRAIQDNEKRILVGMVEAMSRGVRPELLVQHTQEVNVRLEISMSVFFERCGLGKDFDPEQYIRDHS